MHRRTLAIAALAVVALTLSSAAPAMAAGVPGEVVTYIAGDLIDDLNEFYGPGTDGDGVLFTNSTTTTPAVRVFEFTPGIDSDTPVRRVNQWITVLSIDETIVGLATISIEPVSSAPQLDLFIDSPDFGTVVASLPDTATLVHDPSRKAWFALDGETLTPLVAGTSGLTEPVTLDAYRALQPPATDAAPTSTAPPSGLIAAGIILVLIVLLLAVEAFYPFWRRRPVPHVEPAETPDVRVEPAETPAPAEAATTEIAADPPKKPRSPRNKPTASN